MPEQTWAEGSGSTWADLDGDPRIVAGAEVLVGLRSPDVNLGARSHATIGARATVTRVNGITGSDHSGRFGMRAVRITAGESFLWWPACDLVVLRTAEGELTEEGRALEEWAVVVGKAGSNVRIWSTACAEWGERAGILVPGGGIGNPHWTVDRARLAMALGREEEQRSTTTRGHIDDWREETLERVRGIPLSEPLKAAVREIQAERAAAWDVCSHCGVQRASIHGHCADCAQMLDDATVSAAPDDDTRPDLSGEHHLASLRAWTRRPMGTR